MNARITLIVLCLSATVSFAQSSIEDVQLIQSIYGKEKKTIVAEFVHLQGLPEDKFWTIYDQYENERKALGLKRVELLNKYAAAYESMDDQTTSQIIKETAALGAKTDKLIATYFKKIEKSVGAKPAAQFFQLEHYLLSVIRLKIFENIPLIGQTN